MCILGLCLGQDVLQIHEFQLWKYDGLTTFLFYDGNPHMWKNVSISRRVSVLFDQWLKQWEIKPISARRCPFIIYYVMSPDEYFTHACSIMHRMQFTASIKQHAWRILTLNVRGTSYLGLTRSISWLLMPWLLTSPGYQQPWYWLCRISTFLSYLREDLNYLRRINVEKWHKM